MSWRISQAESRTRYLAKFNADEVGQYDSIVGRLGAEDQEAYLSDLRGVFEFRTGMQVLDVGAGPGTLSAVLARVPGLSLTALEPAPAMLAKLESKPELRAVTAVLGFCDADEDRGHFGAASFDVIVSRQLANGLYDPLAAFRNWRHWVRPGGAIIVIDGLYGRDAWAGVWAEEVDVLPLAATQSTSSIPYLLEVAGLQVEAVGLMEAVNRRPATRTRRYMVVARRSPTDD